VLGLAACWVMNGREAARADECSYIGRCKPYAVPLRFSQPQSSILKEMKAYPTYDICRDAFPTENPDWREPYPPVEDWNDDHVAFEFLRRNAAYWEFAEEYYSPESYHDWPKDRLEYHARQRLSRDYSGPLPAATLDHKCGASVLRSIVIVSGGLCLPNRYSLRSCSRSPVPTEYW
jgi:hypothetical protein